MTRAELASLKQKLDKEDLEDLNEDLISRVRRRQAADEKALRDSWKKKS